MLRKLSLLLCVLLLSACTLAPEQTPVVKTDCPVCPTPVTCPTCAAGNCAPLPQPTATQTTLIAVTALPLPTYTPVEPTPTETPLPTFTPVEPTPTETPLPTSTPVEPAVMPFKPQEGTPAALQNFAHPDQACNWMGVAGQVIAADGSPVTRIVVLVTGTLNDQPVEFLGMTGSALDYGLGGYEIELATKPVQTRGQLTLQLFDLDGIPLTSPVVFNTSKDCAKNLILINFTENQPQ